MWGRVLTRPVEPKPDGSTDTNQPVLETYTNYAFTRPTVNPLQSQDFHLFSTAGERQRVKNHSSKPLSFRAACSRAGATRACRGTCFTCLRLFFSTRQNASSSRLVAHRTMPFRHKPRRKTISLIKDHLEVLAHVRLESLTYRTLRGTLSPNEAPWPGLICRN